MYLKNNHKRKYIASLYPVSRPTITKKCNTLILNCLKLQHRLRNNGRSKHKSNNIPRCLMPEYIGQDHK